jgi:hypothetical protein
MPQGYLVDEAFIRAVQRHDKALRSPDHVPRRGRYPVGGGKPGVRFYRLSGANYIHRGSHPAGVEAEEVRVDGTDGGRVTFTTVRSDVILYCGNNGVYVQRDSGRLGNDPGDPDGGDPDDPPPCPPNCTFTGNSPVSSTLAASAPAWWFIGKNAEGLTAGSAATSDSVQCFAVTGMKQNGIDFTIGSWELSWVGVLTENMTGGSGTSGNVRISGLGAVTAFKLCGEGISSGSAVHVIYRELAGIGGFAIVAAICCPGYEV